MNRKFLFVLLFPILSACTSSIAVMATGRDGEFMVVGRDKPGSSPSLELAQQDAIHKADEYCNKMGRSYKKIYSTDRPMFQSLPPISTLYFACADSKSGPSGQTEQQNSAGQASIVMHGCVRVTDTSAPPTIENGTGFTVSGTGMSSDYTLFVTFNSALPDTNYTLIASGYVKSISSTSSCVILKKEKFFSARCNNYPYLCFMLIK